MNDAISRAWRVSRISGAIQFITPYTPEQNGLVERFFRSLKEECIWLHRFESLGQARVVIDRWIRYYNEERPHQSLDYVAPRAHPALAV
ncbi:integrase core domain-containing protein [Larsenimonas salina]|uniref:integrase core domain-containing protein n=1 Tax=Larsenimonas salina TaxID=1295565 RepID=UPI00207448E8|nr:transposase [Larsenimonas salina]MCM5705632.1 transposase [Larsenimonas salina]